MTWEGHVAGSATVFVQADRSDVQGRDTGSIDRPKFKFAVPLPAAEQTAVIRVRKGRGRVQIVEQPAATNEYSVVVQITAPDNVKHEHYVIDFFWNGDTKQKPAETTSKKSAANAPKHAGAVVG